MQIANVFVLVVKLSRYCVRESGGFVATSKMIDAGQQHALQFSKLKVIEWFSHRENCNVRPVEWWWRGDLQNDECCLYVVVNDVLCFCHFTPRPAPACNVVQFYSQVQISFLFLPHTIESRTSRRPYNPPPISSGFKWPLSSPRIGRHSWMTLAFLVHFKELLVL